MYKPKKVSFWKKIWKLRYRMYGESIVFVLTPVLYASSQDLNPNIDVNADQYDTVLHTIIANKIAKIPVKKSVPKQVPVFARVIIKDGEKIYIDKTGQIITDLLLQAGYNAGYIDTEPFLDLNLPLPVQKKEELVDKDKVPKSNNLDSLIPRPNDPTTKNFLRYPKFNINVPVIYSSFEDLFEKKPDGTINFQKPRDNNPVDSPLQKELQSGIVHLAFTPQPGELGNSYIVGHSSNYSFVKSNYNAVFKPLESKCEKDSIFTIYDRFGRELKFKVFECIKIAEGDTQEAYKLFPDRRIVTLQTSILTLTKQGWKPTHRWLTRGELVI